jgi:hypothetical protein
MGCFLKTLFFAGRLRMPNRDFILVLVARMDLTFCRFKGMRELGWDAFGDAEWWEILGREILGRDSGGGLLGPVVKGRVFEVFWCWI